MTPRPYFVLALVFPLAVLTAGCEEKAKHGRTDP